MADRKCYVIKNYVTARGLFAVRVKMAESGKYSGWSSEVSFMDLPMCTGADAEQQVLEITAAVVFQTQFSASLDFAYLYRLVESECYRVKALFYK